MVFQATLIALVLVKHLTTIVIQQPIPLHPINPINYFHPKSILN